VGNANLNQQYDHRIFARYNFSTNSGSSFLGLVRANFSPNYIGNSTFIASREPLQVGRLVVPQGGQLTTPVNIDGFRNFSALTTYGFPFALIKSNVNISLSASYTTQPGLINEQRNEANNFTTGFNTSIASNFSENVDFTVSYGVDWNDVENTLRPQNNNSFVRHDARAESTFIFLGGFTFRQSLNYSAFRGLADGFDQDFALLSVSVGRRFMPKKQAEILIQVFDVLGQNNSIARNITESYIEDVQTNVLQRYAMLTFTYNIRNYVAAPEKDRGGRGRGR
jgi:hypothetical protein